VFSKAPLRRNEKDMLMFKEVFVDPRKTKLLKLSQRRYRNPDDDEKKEELHP